MLTVCFFLNYCLYKRLVFNELTLKKITHKNYIKLIQIICYYYVCVCSTFVFLFNQYNIISKANTFFYGCFLNVFTIKHLHVPACLYIYVKFVRLEFKIVKLNYTKKYSEILNYYYLDSSLCLV